MLNKRVAGECECVWYVINRDEEMVVWSRFTPSRLTSILAAEYVEGKEHGIGEGSGFLLTGKVEPVYLPGISPLMKCRSSLVVF